MTYPVKQITGFYLFDTLITGNWPAFVSSLQHIILPAFTLSAYAIGLIARMTRSTMLEVLGENYIRTAKAWGFSDRVITYVYALKNAIGPTLTVVGLTFAVPNHRNILRRSHLLLARLGELRSLGINEPRFSCHNGSHANPRVRLCIDQPDT